MATGSGDKIPYKSCSFSIFYAPAAPSDEHQCSSESFPRRRDWFSVATCFWQVLKRNCISSMESEELHKFVSKEFWTPQVQRVSGWLEQGALFSESCNNPTFPISVLFLRFELQIAVALPCEQSYNPRKIVNLNNSKFEFWSGLLVGCIVDRDAKVSRYGRYICTIIFKVVLILLYWERIGTGTVSIVLSGLCFNTVVIAQIWLYNTIIFTKNINNVTKYLLIFNLQNISLLSCYLYNNKSIHCLSGPPVA